MNIKQDIQDIKNKIRSFGFNVTKNDMLGPVALASVERGEILDYDDDMEDDSKLAVEAAMVYIFQLGSKLDLEKNKHKNFAFYTLLYQAKDENIEPFAVRGTFF